jgi:prepilin-type N-terminal cleavage/methylation domain-containing protein
MRNRSGHTLIELALALAIAAVIAGAAAIPTGRARSSLAVHAARSELTALAALARSTAIASGGAALLIDVPCGCAWIELTGSGTRVDDVHHVAERHGVRLAAARTRVTVRYDALGIGRLANAVVQISSGAATGTLTISAYGRVRQS